MKKLWDLIRYSIHKPQGKSARISPPDAFASVRARKAVLVDVREKDELEEEGLAEPARWIATSLVESESPEVAKFEATLPRDRTIIVYCAAGVRSGRFADRLAAKGFQTANLGGFKDWKNAGLPVRRYSPGSQ